MKIKGLIIALAVLVLAVAGYFVATGLTSKAEADKEAAKVAGRLNDADPADIDRIVYNYKGTTYEFVLDSDGETWLYPADPAFPLKQRLIRAMATGVEKIISVQQVDEAAAADLAQYGLDKPQCVVSLSMKDGSALQYNIGNYSTLPKGYYVNPAGTADVHIVKSDIECYLLSLVELAVQDNIPYVLSGNAEQVSFSTPEDSFTFSRFKDGKPDFYNPAIQWFEDREDDTLVGGDSVKFREFVTDLNALEVHSCAFYPYSEADLADFGLKADSCRSMTIRYGDGQTGEPKTFTLEVGGPVPEEVRDGYYSYIHVVGSDLICTVKTEDLEKTVLLERDHFLSKDVCMVNYEDILEMDLTIDGETYHFTSTKEDSVDKFGYDVTVSTFYLDGEEVNSEYFRVLQSGFSSIDAEAFAEDGENFADEAPYIRIVYTTTKTLDHAVLEFIPYNANFYLARFGGRCDMLVGRQSLRIAASRLDNLLASLNDETPEDAPAA